MSAPHPPYKISVIPPPGPAVLSLPLPPSSSSPPPSSSSHPQDRDPSISPLFHDALAVRYAVFVNEQACPADEEIDDDDKGSWHWVLYVDQGGDGDGGVEKGGDEEDEGGDKVDERKWIPAATIRLVPARAGLVGGGGGGGGGEGEKEEGEKKKDKPTSPTATTHVLPSEPNMPNSTIWNGKEPYARIGRLATLKAFRGRGYGRILVEEALRWAGGHLGDLGGGSVGGDWDGRKGGDAEGLVWKGLVLAHAQVAVEGWYRGLHWRTDEGLGRWDEVGIQHVGMWRRVGGGG